MAGTKFATYFELPEHGVPKYSRKHLIDLQRRGQFPKARQISPNRNRLGCRRDREMGRVAPGREELSDCRRRRKNRPGGLSRGGALLAQPGP